MNMECGNTDMFDFLKEESFNANPTDEFLLPFLIDYESWTRPNFHFPINPSLSSHSSEVCTIISAKVEPDPSPSTNNSSFTSNSAEICTNISAPFERDPSMTIVSPSNELNGDIEYLREITSLFAVDVVKGSSLPDIHQNEPSLLDITFPNDHVDPFYSSLLIDLEKAPKGVQGSDEANNTNSVVLNDTVAFGETLSFEESFQEDHFLFNFAPGRPLIWKDVLTLKAPNFLNDTIISFYLDHIVKQLEINEKAFICSTFFYSNLNLPNVDRFPKNSVMVYYFTTSCVYVM